MDAKRIFGLTLMMVKAGLTGISGAATTHSTGSTTLQYSIGGKAYSKAQISGGTTPVVDAVDGSAITLTANKGRAVVWCLDSSGNVKLVAGPVQDLDSAGNFMVTPQFGPVPLNTLCPFAYTIHKGGSTLSGTFTIGSSNWNTTGHTVAVVDIMNLPDRPQVS